MYRAIESPPNPVSATEWPATVAVLISGGLDSAILLGDALRRGSTVHPLYLRMGLYWEEAELHFLRRYLDALRGPALAALRILELPVADLYGEHWSLHGRAVPDADSPDEAVFLPGRNVLLLSKAILWCYLHSIPAVALGTLAGNPFPDATPNFFTAFQNVVNQAIGGAVRVLAPYAGWSKIAVLRQGDDLPLHWTLSCIHPRGARHCGRCNKCAERRRAFAESGLRDQTEYDD
jgi:7-cyano-7-deazaguanine synthase